ncbi:hypothetical protein MIR68_007913 [Amoeboaphelidium protococcarum]|nr:hypothetical protein MIR68_007913 [Amoeboaphelidium protococcarum]
MMIGRHDTILSIAVLLSCLLLAPLSRGQPTSSSIFTPGGHGAGTDFSSLGRDGVQSMVDVMQANWLPQMIPTESADHYISRVKQYCAVMGNMRRISRTFYDAVAQSPILVQDWCSQQALISRIYNIFREDLNPKFAQDIVAHHRILLDIENSIDVIDIVNGIADTDSKAWDALDFYFVYKVEDLQDQHIQSNAEQRALDQLQTYAQSGLNKPIYLSLDCYGSIDMQWSTSLILSVNKEQISSCIAQYQRGILIKIWKMFDESSKLFVGSHFTINLFLDVDNGAMPGKVSEIVLDPTLKQLTNTISQEFAENQKSVSDLSFDSSVLLTINAQDHDVQRRQRQIFLDVQQQIMKLFPQAEIQLEIADDRLKMKLEADQLRSFLTNGLRHQMGTAFITLFAQGEQKYGDALFKTLGDKDIWQRNSIVVEDLQIVLINDASRGKFVPLLAQLARALSSVKVRRVVVQFYVQSLTRNDIKVCGQMFTAAPNQFLEKITLVNVMTDDTYEITLNERIY